MHTLFARWSLRRRIVALAAAYAIALGGLIASWAAGNAAALAAAGSATITCHSDGVGEPPPHNGDSSNVCIDSCCVGCVLLFAALPPPPIKTIGVPQSAARPSAAMAAVPIAAEHATRSHRSRAPPLRT